VWGGCVVVFSFYRRDGARVEGGKCVGGGVDTFLFLCLGGGGDASYGDDDSKGIAKRDRRSYDPPQKMLSRKFPDVNRDARFAHG